MIVESNRVGSESNRELNLSDLVMIFFILKTRIESIILNHNDS